MNFGLFIDSQNVYLLFTPSLQIVNYNLRKWFSKRLSGNLSSDFQKGYHGTFFREIEPQFRKVKPLKRSAPKRRSHRLSRPSLLSLKNWGARMGNDFWYFCIKLSDFHVIFRIFVNREEVRFRSRDTFRLVQIDFPL